MRKVLLRFVFDWTLQFRSVGNELHVSIVWLITIWIALTGIAFWVLYRKSRNAVEAGTTAGFWLLFPAFFGFLLIMKPRIGIVETGIPVFGYGFMMFIGFSLASLSAARRIRSMGQPPEVIWDMMMWALIPGLIGARLYYLAKYGDQVFAKAQGFGKVIAAIALWDGGIVFYGSVAGGILGILTFCRRRQIKPIPLFDVLAPSLLIGEGFGRIGCFLYGCCFGGQCDLPWATRFPPDSLTWEKLVEWGQLPPDAPFTMPLHPTQLYSSASAFLLAGILAWFYRRRPFDGAVMSLAWILYPINRYLLETLRADVDPRSPIVMKDAQAVSLLLVASGVAAMVWFSKHRQLTQARTGIDTATPQPPLPG